MIEKIKLKNVATFSEEIIIDNLKKINFFYGANGSGKTTITKVIAEPINYNNCKIEWKLNKELKRIIFNEDFIKKYFYEKDNLVGIYTIGEGAIEIEQEILDRTKNLEENSKKLNELKQEKINKENEKSNLFNDFKEKCWNKGYLELQQDFDEFFTGYKRNKEKFASEILGTNFDMAKLQEKERLKEKYKLIYGKDVKALSEISLLPSQLIEDIKALEENNNILNISIVGKKDVDIAKMIEKLHNHDWVKQGKEYFDKNFDAEKNAYFCPFCQQKTSDEFKKQLEEYFDETYKNYIEELKKYKEDYNAITSKIIKCLDDILKNTNEYLDTQKNILQDKRKIIEELINFNLNLLEKKLNNPSEKIQIKTIYKYLIEVNDILENTNKKIKEHNLLITNRETEKKMIDDEIWNFIVDKLQSVKSDYENKNNNILNALKNLEIEIKNMEDKIKQINYEIGELEKKKKSIKPTVDAINKILSSFGFKNFKLKTTDDEKYYCIIRDDGTDAKKTLSEGERNFLVFLYFYYLINGVENPEENINQDKILIIDDPVSSFDSNVLFIVSTLIRKILQNIRSGNENNIKQAFIFTHNAYFFKEITFISSRESCYIKRNDTMYYIIRKKDNISTVEQYETNPIKTSYQLLWDEIKKDNIDCISIQNSMRRIIEFYFKFLANLKEQELIDKFEGEEKNICQSLIAWINVGSHEILDDFNCSISNENIVTFKEIFRKIFKYTGHISHYNMMMGINENFS